MFPLIDIVLGLFVVALFGLTYYSITMRLQMRALQKELSRKEEQLQLESLEIAYLKEEMSDQSLVDSLTGLPNRQVFEDRLTITLIQSARYQQIFSVMSLDIDHFKIINDALSLEAGDYLLSEIAKRLTESIRKIDTVSRFNGNEFLFIFPQIMKPETAGYIARRILNDLSRPFDLEGQEIYLTASIGITVFPADGSDVSALIRNANSALRQAKIQGRNNYQFYRPETQALSKRDLILDSALRQESVCQEFVIYYQPEVHADTHRVVCMSASPSWQHPEFGLLPFSDFASLLEASGRINAVGEWLIRMVCQQFIVWREQKFFPGAMSVPFSLKQLENPHFVPNLGTLLQEYHIDPESLIFVITDTTFVTKIDRVEKMLRMLKHLGIRKAINSFGANSLSLQYLRRLSVDIFQIDSALVKELTVHPESESIVQMVIALAESLNATVVAEGVETIEQKNRLLELNCHVMQGPLFGMPMTAKDITLEKMESMAEKV